MSSKDDDATDANIVRYPVMPSLVALQLMRNRCHLAQTGKKLMTWTSLATGKELRKLSKELAEIYVTFREDMSNCFMLLARARYFCPSMNETVVNNLEGEACITIEKVWKSITGVKVIKLIPIDNGRDSYPYLGIGLGGIAINEAKKAWRELLKSLIVMATTRVEFLELEDAHRNATNRSHTSNQDHGTSPSNSFNGSDSIKMNDKVKIEMLRMKTVLKNVKKILKNFKDVEINRSKLKVIIHSETEKQLEKEQKAVGDYLNEVERRSQFREDDINVTAKSIHSCVSFGIIENIPRLTISMDFHNTENAYNMITTNVIKKCDSITTHIHQNISSIKEKAISSNNATVFKEIKFGRNKVVSENSSERHLKLNYKGNVLSKPNLVVNELNDVVLNGMNDQIFQNRKIMRPNRKKWENVKSKDFDVIHNIYAPIKNNGGYSANDLLEHKINNTDLLVDVPKFKVNKTELNYKDVIETNKNDIREFYSLKDAIRNEPKASIEPIEINFKDFTSMECSYSHTSKKSCNIVNNRVQSKISNIERYCKNFIELAKYDISNKFRNNSNGSNHKSTDSATYRSKSDIKHSQIYNMSSTMSSDVMKIKFKLTHSTIIEENQMSAISDENDYQKHLHTIINERTFENSSTLKESLQQNFTSVNEKFEQNICQNNIVEQELFEIYNEKSEQNACLKENNLTIIDEFRYESLKEEVKTKLITKYMKKVNFVQLKNEKLRELHKLKAKKIVSSVSKKVLSKLITCEAKMYNCNKQFQHCKEKISNIHNLTLAAYKQSRTKLKRIVKLMK